MVRLFCIAAMLLFASIISIACSGQDGFSDVTTPALTPANDGISSDAHQLWGYFQFTIDPTAGSVDITPLRMAEMHVNALVFLEPPALTYLTLESLEFDGSIIKADIGLRHPFLGLHEFTGFDVSGIVISNGSYAGFEDSSIRTAGPGDLYLVNADGHSRWWNPAEFPVNDGTIFAYSDGLLGTPHSFANYNSTLNGYKYFADGLEPDDPVSAIDTSDRGLFSAGQKNIRHYTIDMGQTGLVFNYAIDACWQFPGGSSPWQIPDDFGENANRQEPYFVEIVETENSLWHDGTSYGGTLSLDINIYDWFNLDQDWVSVESAGAFDAVDLTVPTGGGADYSTFHVDLTDVDLSSSDDLMILITAYCEDIGFQDFIPGKTTAAYNVHYAPVSDEPGLNPTAVAKTCDCLYIAPGGSIQFDGTDSYSPNGNIVDWEWDFDGDGDFTDPYSGFADKPTATYMTEGDYWVNLRVTDNIGLTDTLSADEQLHVFVGYFTPPTAVAEIVPTIGFINFEGEFTGSNSIGTIDLYEWDFEGDCIWDYEHPTIGDTTHAYTEEGEYNAILRVTGDGCDTHETSVRMIEPLGFITNGNFWDGDFPPWEHGHWNKPGPLVEEIIPSPIFKNIVHFSSGPTSDGNCTWITQELDEDVSDYTHLYCNFFFNIDFNTLYGDGWLAGDPDMLLKVRYEDTTGEEWAVWYAYDISFDGTWQWDSPQPPPWTLPDYVVYHEQEVVPEDTWLERKTINLMTLDPPPARIINVRISCRGWSWNAYTTLPWFSTE